MAPNVAMRITGGVCAQTKMGLYRTACPQKESFAMIASERSLYILRAIHERGVINLKEIAQHVGTSEATVRRDLEKLEREGKLMRVQGGATTNGGTEQLFDRGELAMRSKTLINQDEKKAVALEAAKNVRDGESVFLDCGTSIAPLAALLLSRPVQIVTYSALVIAQAGNPKAEVMLIGGLYNAHHNMFTGLFAEQMLRNFRFDHAFIGCYGVSIEEDKCFDLDMASTNMKLIAMENTARRYLLIDDSKLEKKGFYSFGELSSYDGIYCSKPQQPTTVPKNFTLV